MFFPSIYGPSSKGKSHKLRRRSSSSEKEKQKGKKKWPANTKVFAPSIRTAIFCFRFSLASRSTSYAKRGTVRSLSLKELVTDDYVPWAAHCLFWLCPPCITTTFLFGRNWFFRFRKLLWQAFATRFWIRRGDSPSVNPITWNNTK